MLKWAATFDQENESFVRWSEISDSEPNLRMSKLYPMKIKYYDVFCHVYSIIVLWNQLEIVNIETILKLLAGQHLSKYERLAKIKPEDFPVKPVLKI